MSFHCHGFCCGRATTMELPREVQKPSWLLAACALSVERNPWWGMSWGVLAALRELCLPENAQVFLQVCKYSECFSSRRSVQPSLPFNTLGKVVFVLPLSALLACFSGVILPQQTFFFPDLQARQDMTVDSCYELKNPYFVQRTSLLTHAFVSKKQIVD